MRKPSPDDLRKLKDKAAEATGKGKLDKAAELYRAAADGDPRDVGTRQRLAEVLRRAGRTPEAIQAYREVAERFGADGLLIKAIAISKTILELDPQHVETQSALAALYSKKAAAEAARPPPRTLMVAAMSAAAARPTQPPAPAQPPRKPAQGDDAVVAIALGPPPPAAKVSPPPPSAPASPEPLEIAIDTDPFAAPAVFDPSEVVFEPDPPADAPPPARPQAGFEAPARAARRRQADEVAATPFERIVFAAEAAVEAGQGIDEDLLIQADPLEVEVVGDEPLELVIEPEPELAPEPPPPAPVAPPPPAPAARPQPPPAPARPAPRPAPARPPPPPPPPPPGLPRIPIFSDLGREAFLELTQGMVLHRVAPGEAVIREGEDGTSFFVVASGKLVVSKRDDARGQLVLARLGEGEFFGEMALLSGTSRSATVTAEEATEVLEFRADVLLDVAGHHPHVAQSLRRFYRQRLLANAMAVSPVFRPFQRGERKLIMERFRAREVAAGETVIREGEPSDGLYVVLEGAVDVVKRSDGQDLVVGNLREGDLFGEMSCLRKAPASASVVVRRSGTLLRLPRKEFDDLVVTYPQILELVATLSEERAENLDAILTGHAEWTEDGLVLT